MSFTIQYVWFSSYDVVWLLWGMLASSQWGFDTVSYQPALLSRAPVEVWQRSLSTRALSNPKHALFVKADSAEEASWLRQHAPSCERGRWCPVVWDASFLKTVLLSGRALHVRASPAHQPLLMQSRREVGASAVHGGQGVRLARKGKGVLVGVIDTGIELSHQAFRTASGVSRVVAVWDQDASGGEAPKAFRYGVECTVRVLRAGACALTDPVGHGTHVAGIAAGSGNTPGMAPEADIAVVRSRDFTRLADAVEYLTLLAQEREQAVVINVSVGGQYGPHDGQTPLENYLGMLTGPGRVVVGAAGNDGASSVHIGGNLTSSGTRMTVEGLSYVGADTLLEFWVSDDATLHMAVEIWLGGSAVASVDVSAGEQETVATALRYQGQMLLEIQYGANSEREGSMVRHALVFSPKELSLWPAGAVMVVKLSGKGFVDGWVSQSDYVHGQARFGGGLGEGWFSGDGRRSVTVPATSPHIVAVGSYTIRNSWKKGVVEEWLSGAALGFLAPYSSVGPTPFPLLTGWKPDVCAPGSSIASARAKSVLFGSSTLDDDQVFMQGTSMAAPHVTGVVALMLEADPTLTPLEIRSLLQRSARSDGFTGATPNAEWGFGKLDAVRAVSLVESRLREGCSAFYGDCGVWVVLGWCVRWLRRTSLLKKSTKP